MLAYLVWQGIKAMQPQTTTIWRAHRVGRIADRICQQGNLWPHRAISGATAGYFIGSTIALLRAYWRQRTNDVGS